MCCSFLIFLIMAAVTMNRDLVENLKKEISSNARVLNKLQPMSTELSRLIFKESAVKKPTQNMFNHLSYYLVSIIDAPTADKFLWPINDSKAEKTYRSQLSAFINDYSTKGFLYPVMSSYLVNPGCYEVIMLMFQMSQLAVQRLLLSKITTDSKKDLYKKMTENYKTASKDFVEDIINKQNEVILNKFYQHQRKRVTIEKIASMFRERIISMEEKLSNVQKFIDNLIDSYIKDKNLDKATKTEILNIKNVEKPAKFFDDWLQYVDENVKDMDFKWDQKVTPLVDVCTQCHKNTVDLLARHTGEADCNSYMFEYNHLTDEICTKELENQVNSQQKYILKNIVRNERLYFPNLIRSFLISFSYILRNNEIGDEINKFNEYLENGYRNINELVSAMKSLNARVMNADTKLQAPKILFEQSLSVKEFQIPPLPDLSGIKATEDSTEQILFETFTPLSMSKHQFNLCRKYNSFSFSKPQAKALITPFHQAPRDSFLNSHIVSCCVSTYDQSNVSNNFNNISVISQENSRGNETKTEESKTETPKTDLQLIRKTSSLENIISRFKKVRANVMPSEGNDGGSDFMTWRRERNIE